MNKYQFTALTSYLWMFFCLTSMAIIGQVIWVLAILAVAWFIVARYYHDKSEQLDTGPQDITDKTEG